MEHDAHGVEESEPRLRTLIYFGLFLMALIGSVIGIAAIIGA